MRKLATTAVVFIALLLPGVAKAGFILESSIGKGLQVSPSVQKDLQPVNLLVAPGYGLGKMIRAELGVVLDLPKESKDLNLRLRPMLVVDPPILPIYGRVILGVANLLDKSRAFEFGGAIGAGGSLGPVGLFGEVGVIPQAASDGFVWLLEGRVGGYYAF